MDYAPESKSVLKISRESLNGMENRFYWGQAVRAEYIEDKVKCGNAWSGQKGYTRVKGGRASVFYIKKISTCGKLVWIFLISVYFIMCIALRTSLHRRYLSS